MLKAKGATSAVSPRLPAASAGRSARNAARKRAPQDASMVENGKSNKNRLRLRRVVDVPLREVSGICLRRSRNGRMFLIAVGDRVAKIAWFSQPRSDEGRIDWHTSNIAKLSGSMLPKHDSQIEAVLPRARFVAPGNTAACRTHRPRGVEGGCVDRSYGGRARRNCSSVVRPEGVAGRRNGATARRAFARRQGEETGGFH